MKIKLTCDECGKQFERDKWLIKPDKPTYCSKQCACRTVGKKSAIPWNKGLTSETSIKVKNAGKKIAKSHQKEFAAGRTIWNKGLTKETDERVAGYVESQTRLRNTEGEWKDKWRASLSKAQVKAHAEGKYPHTFTKIEQRTWKYLESQGFVVRSYQDRADDDTEGTWYHQFPVDGVWVADFGRDNPKRVIECNGCYVHGHDLSKCTHRTAKYGWSKFSERNNQRDGKKYNYYQRKGWKYALVWECEAEQDDFHRINKYFVKE